MITADAFCIDRDSHIPIAEQIASQISAFILNRKIHAGEKLPPERELAQGLNVSRGTVKRAYSHLVAIKAIEMRPGSGSYVLKNSQQLEQNQKREATKIIRQTFERLEATGLSDKEIYNLTNLYYLGLLNQNRVQKISIIVLSNNHAILSELEQQLAYISDSSPLTFTLAFMTIDMLYRSANMTKLLLGYDLVIATSIDYPDILRMVPDIKEKTIEACLSPSSRTLHKLEDIPFTKHIAIVYRTEIFKDLVRNTLLDFGFSDENIFLYQEQYYTPGIYEKDNIDIVISFSGGSRLTTEPGFKAYNDDFIAQGGIFIRFEYQVQRSSLLYIEDCLQRLLADQLSS